MTAKYVPGENPFQALLGLSEASDYIIYKNGAPADVYDIEKYDVAFFDKSSGILNVSDFKITGYYSAAYPNSEAPSQITVLGHTFDVAESAVAPLSEFETGDTVTFLFTSDYRVAAAYSPSKLTASAPIGVVNSFDEKSGKISVSLINGIEISSEYSGSECDSVGKLVYVYSSGSKLKVSDVSMQSSQKSDFDVASESTGNSKLAYNCSIFDSIDGKCLVKCDIDDISAKTIPKKDILYVGTNISGDINLIVLNNVTGDCLTYGFVSKSSVESNGVTSTVVSVENSDGKSAASGKFNKSVSFSNAGGIAVSDGKTVAYTALTKYFGISREDFSGTDYICIDGKYIFISDNVQIYSELSDSWTTDISAAKASGSVFTVYCDSSSCPKIRMIIIEK